MPFLVGFGSNKRGFALTPLETCNQNLGVFVKFDLRSTLFSRIVIVIRIFSCNLEYSFMFMKMISVA